MEVVTSWRTLEVGLGEGGVTLISSEESLACSLRHYAFFLFWRCIATPGAEFFFRCSMLPQQHLFFFLCVRQYYHITHHEIVFFYSWDWQKMKGDSGYIRWPLWIPDILNLLKMGHNLTESGWFWPRTDWNGMERRGHNDFKFVFQKPWPNPTIVQRERKTGQGNQIWKRDSNRLQKLCWSTRCQKPG